MERCAGGDHIADILIPTREIARQTDCVAFFPETWRNRIGMAFLAVRSDGRTVLMPAIRLVRAVLITRKNLQHDIRANCVCLFPTIDHAACIGTIRINEHDEAAANAQKAGVTPIFIAQISQVVGDLSRRWIALAFIFIIHRPAEVRAGGSL